MRVWISLLVPRIGYGRGSDVLPLRRLRTPRPSIEATIDELLNGPSRYEGSVVIVLDDLHHVRGDQSLRSLVYAVERLQSIPARWPRTRSDPGRGWPGSERAAHWVSCGQDLAFTVSEMGELLKHAGITARDAELELLVDRTRGSSGGG